MDMTLVLKAIADETRMRIITSLLRRGYCVQALARSIGLSEATVSEHLRVLRKAGLLTGTKRGYYMHYEVERDLLRELAGQIEALAAIEREAGDIKCTPGEHKSCHAKKDGCKAKGHCRSKSEGGGQHVCKHRQA